MVFIVFQSIGLQWMKVRFSTGLSTISTLEDFRASRTAAMSFFAASVTFW